MINTTSYPAWIDVHLHLDGSIPVDTARRLAAEQGIPYVDYYSALVVDDPSRALNPAYSNDGVHPVAAGYEVMEPLLLEAVARALTRACSPSDDCACCH